VVLTPGTARVRPNRRIRSLFSTFTTCPLG
jgi:hypothetical protein